MSHHRPRASDFDPPTRDQRSPSPSHHQRQQQRRPSPNYERGNQQNRLTPEESLDRHHRNHHHHQQERPRENNYSNGGYRQGGRDDFFEKRRLDRANAPVIGLWPKSPTQAYGEEKQKKKGSSSKKEDRHRSSKDKKKHKSSRTKHHRSSDDDSGTDQSDDHNRSHKKHKSRRRKKKYESESEDESSDDERARRSKKRKGKSKSVELDDRKEEEDDDVWMEKEVAPPTTTTTIQPETTPPKKESLPGPSRPIATPIEQPVETGRAESLVDDEEDVGEVGPMPYNHATGKAMDPKEFGRALRPGEGSAMAAFIEAGERIPRRGEIGLTGTEIEKFENVGYVMSGSRHRRMNAVRIRKENQVISAEEKRGILKMQAEEKAKREGQIISSFRELVDTKLQETGQN
ncbi:hypothetical protein PTTG_09154 [Puccinia triticina 1-1 BBBD Race 1]|uniref:Nkap_C domain-containing protein n=1 Tax=Puccinia triticina (isolate 1-1 / race 1 (BBBD)) TaxID=630390 RepID=A0A180G6I8_PUCT1|nr:hypothetical protein PTTG_09154 [Puccinia triticina 1-1 BBBD Race 1]WAR63674.1 hypothetical protein PtB15_17B275 [Puccinia triticina]